MRFYKHKKWFTLIELIVVIVILGILAAIVIPNISTWKDEATHTAVISNTRNLQTSVDMYALKNNGVFPTVLNPTVLEPKPIDFEGIIPKYSRTLPKTKGVYYWVDYQGKVWAATIDSPKGVILNSNILSWEAVEGATKYRVYEYTGGSLTGSAKQTSKFNLVKEQEATGNLKENLTVPTGKVYAVSSLDENGFESAPAGQLYKGYEGYIKSENVEVVKACNPNNLIPIMTGYTQPTGKVSASTEYTSLGQVAYWAVDGKSNTSWGTTGGGGWLEYDFGTPKRVTKYTLQSVDQSDPSVVNQVAPKDWTLEAFDGSKWVILDTQKGITNWVQGVKKEFIVSNENGYNRYRLNVSSTNGWWNLNVGEFQLAGCDGGVIPSEQNPDPVPQETIQTPVGYTDNIIPAMKSNTSPTGVVSYSSETSHGYGYMVFNGTANGWTDRWFTPFVKNTWIQYQFPTEKKVVKYEITSVGGDNGWGGRRSPKTWEFKGSTDGVNWIVLDQRANVTDWTDAMTKSFTFTNNKFYSYYRLEISELNTGNDNNLEISEIRMMEGIY